jgi:hypothetical protein
VARQARSRPARGLIRRFTGSQGYDFAGPRTDLARFTFLPGHDDGEQIFGHDQARPDTESTAAKERP